MFMMITCDDDDNDNSCYNYSTWCTIFGDLFRPLGYTHYKHNFLSKRVRTKYLETNDMIWWYWWYDMMILVIWHDMMMIWWYDMMTWQYWWYDIIW